MPNADDRVKFIYYTPDNITGLLRTMNTCKSYRLCFDDLESVDIIDKSAPGKVLNKAIYPGYIPDLSALKRSERYFDIGPELRINELLRKFGADGHIVCVLDKGGSAGAGEVEESSVDQDRLEAKKKVSEFLGIDVKLEQ